MLNWPVRVSALPAQGLAVSPLGDGGRGNDEHVDADHIHCAHVAPDGPCHVPPEQRPVNWHQPQPVAPEQSPQLANESQLPHVLEGGHVPTLGSTLLPVLHVLVLGHQPQPVVDAHDWQEVFAEQVAVGFVTVHWLAPQVHSRQLPEEGPRYEPYVQYPADEHQPHTPHSRPMSHIQKDR
jgi:hypothetical protein